MPEQSARQKGQKARWSDEMERAVRIQEKENMLMGYLSPIESSVMTFQNVLVWDNPQHSIVLFIVVHILFWLAASVRIYYIIGLTGTIIVAVDMWKNHIWPEIRVPPPPGEDDEDWTPVHPRLLSVPEICHWLAQWWVYISELIETAIILRKKNHSKFFLNAVLCLSFLAVLGCYIPGILIAYLTVLFCLLWPCILYHDGLTKMQEILQPAITNLEQRINIKRKRKGKRKSKHHPADKPRSDERDSDSEGLQEFMPKIDKPQELIPKLDQSNSEDEEGFKSGLLTPPAIPSRTPSRDGSDTDDVLKTSTDELGSLVSDLKDIPSYSDVLDGGDNHDDKAGLGEEEISELQHAVEEAITEELTEQDTVDSVPLDEDINQETMQFISSHFSQFSDEEDEDTDKDSQSKATAEDPIIKELSEDISSFPDVEDSTSEQTAAQAMMASGLQMLTDQSQSLISQGQALVSAFGSTDVSGLMASTLSGLSTIRDTVSSVVHQSQLSQTTKDVPRTDNEGSTKQVEAEFEFLNEADLAQAVLENVGEVDEGGS